MKLIKINSQFHSLSIKFENFPILNKSLTFGPKIFSCFLSFKLLERKKLIHSFVWNLRTSDPPGVNADGAVTMIQGTKRRTPVSLRDVRLHRYHICWNSPSIETSLCIDRSLIIENISYNYFLWELARFWFMYLCYVSTQKLIISFCFNPSPH